MSRSRAGDDHVADLNTETETTQTPDQASPRRRALLRAAAAAPFVATLPSGAARATASTYQCMIKDQEYLEYTPELVTEITDTAVRKWVRYWRFEDESKQVIELFNETRSDSVYEGVWYDRDLKTWEVVSAGTSNGTKTVSDTGTNSETGTDSGSQTDAEPPSGITTTQDNDGTHINQVVENTPNHFLIKGVYQAGKPQEAAVLVIFEPRVGESGSYTGIAGANVYPKLQLDSGDNLALTWSCLTSIDPEKMTLGNG